MLPIIFLLNFLDRMPVILGNNASIDEWLDPLRTSKFDSGLGPYEGSDLVSKFFYDRGYIFTRCGNDYI